MLLDRRCGGCRRPGPSLCVACRSGLAPPPLGGHGGLIPGRVDHLVALTAYDDLAAHLVLSAKNGGRVDVLAALADELARAVGAADHAIDEVTWVPASGRGRRHRGFDQGALLARRIGRRCHVPVRRLLRRRSGQAQHGGSRAARLVGPDLRMTRRLPRPRVLVVDDVATTGASLNAAAAALRAAGASEIVGAVVAVVVDHRPVVDATAEGVDGPAFFYPHRTGQQEVIEWT